MDNPPAGKIPLLEKAQDLLQNRRLVLAVNNWAVSLILDC